MQKESSMPAPKEMEKIQKTRTESDAKLLKDGAEYVENKTGARQLDMTREQKNKVMQQMLEEKMILDNIGEDDDSQSLMRKMSKKDLLETAKKWEEEDPSPQRALNAYEVLKDLDKIKALNMWLARQNEREQRYEEAAWRYKKAGNIDKSHEMWKKRGKQWSKKGYNLEIAAESYEKAGEMAIARKLFIKNGKIAAKKHLYDKAARSFEKAGKEEDSKQYWEKTIARGLYIDNIHQLDGDRNDIVPYTKLAEAHRRLGQEDEADKILSQYHEHKINDERGSLYAEQTEKFFS